MDVIVKGENKDVEHRALIVDAAATPANNTAIATTELTTYTFDAADDRRQVRITFISDPSNEANGPQGAVFTINAIDNITAVSRMSLAEGDADDRAFRIGRGKEIEIMTDSPITRIDIAGILPGGVPAYANDLIQLEIW